MDQDEYIKSRVDNQIDYYDTQSVESQTSFKRLTGLQIVSGALIPIVSGFSDEICYSDWITAILGLVVTCTTAFLALNKHQERWINYRTTCETLRHLKHLFLTSSTPYRGDDRFDQFVQDIESTISKENSDWSRNMLKDNKN